MVMSKIGRKPISIPEAVKVKVEPRAVVVSGVKGSLTVAVPAKIKVEKKEGQILVQRLSEQKKIKALHGTIRQLIANAIVGVSQGWEKKLEIVGTGYRASLEGETLVLSVGFSHPVKINSLSGIKLEVEGQTRIKVSGVDKALVGRAAAEIRAVRPPDPYKGKGIRYTGEVVKLKPGKAAKGEAVGIRK